MSEPASVLDQFVKLVVPALVGAIVAFAATTINSRLEQRRRDREERAKIKTRYLDPLRLAVNDLLHKLTDINRRIEHHDTLLRDMMVEFKGRPRDNSDDFARWSNGYGHFALSSVYMTEVYFAHASRIRSELPFIQIASGDEQDLLNHLNRVRQALDSNRFGIWAELQDSLGDYIRKDGGALMNYRDFCRAVNDSATYGWFLRLLEFYADIHLKTESERQEMLASLRALADFLEITRP